VWPGVIERAIAVIEEAPFLSEAQVRDILYNNAARFLRLSEQEIARHHGRSLDPVRHNGSVNPTIGATVSIARRRASLGGLSRNR
jgi:hypothetical protein